MSTAKPSYLAPSNASPVSLALVPHNERVLASASYFASLVGFWFVIPAVLYVWKGRQSRFLGFHAVQSVLLQVALIPIGFLGIGLAFTLAMLVELIGGNSVAPFVPLVLFGVLGLTAMAPIAATVWVGFCALRGQPRALPVLGRWARRVVGD